MQRNSGEMEEGGSGDDHDVGVDFPLTYLHFTIPSFEDLGVHLRAVTQPVLETGEVGGAVALGGAYGDQQMNIPPPESEADFYCDQEIPNSIDEHVQGSIDEHVQGSIDEHVQGSIDEHVQGSDELVSNREDQVLGSEEEAPHVEEYVPTLTQTEATAPTSSSPCSVDSSTQTEATAPTSSSPCSVDSSTQTEATAPTSSSPCSVGSCTQTEATAPTSSSPCSVDSSTQTNTSGSTTTNPSDNSEFVLEMFQRKFTPVLDPHQADGEVSPPPATSPMVPQQNISTESNRMPPVSNNANEPNADRQAT